MDFLEIRRKAKERAVARAAADASAGSAEPATAQGTPGSEPALGLRAIAASLPAELPPEPDLAGAAPAAAADPERAERLQDLRAPDQRFTTWRPGAGAPPVPLDHSALGPGPDRPAEPLAVVQPGGNPAREPEPDPERATATPDPAEALRAAPPGATPPETAPGPARPQAPLDEFFYRPDEDAPGIPQLGFAPALDPVAGAEPAPIDEYLAFRLGDEEYGLAITQVREVMKAPVITEVPRAPAHILGVVTVRGEVVPVFDPRRRLDLPAGAPVEGGGRVVIVDAGEGMNGLLVDAVSSVVRLRRGTVEPCPQGIGGAASDCLAGIGRERDRLFTILDLPALLRRGPAARRPGEGRPHAGA